MMDDLEKIRDYLHKIVRRNDLVISSDGWVNNRLVKVFGNAIYIRKKKFPERGDDGDNYWDTIPLADPDCFKKFEEWVKGLK